MLNKSLHLCTDCSESNDEDQALHYRILPYPSLPYLAVSLPYPPSQEPEEETAGRREKTARDDADKHYIGVRSRRAVEKKLT